MRYRGFVCCGIFLFLFGCSPIHLSSELTPSEGDWPMFGRNVSHSNYADSALVAFPMSLAWKYDASAGFGPGAMSLSDGILFVGTLQGELHVIDAVKGTRFGYKKFHSPISCSPVVNLRHLYFGIEEGKETFISFDFVENEVEWTRPLGPISTSPLLFDGKIYVGSLNGTCYCLDTLKGEELWKCETNAAIHSSPVASDSLIIFGDDNGLVHAVSARAGSPVWNYQTNAAVFGSPMVAAGVVFIASRDHFLYALDAHKGNLLWKYDAGDRIVASPSANDSLVFIGALNGGIAALNQHDGKEVWKFTASSVINSSCAVTKSAVFVGSLNTELYALSPLDGSVLWKYKFEHRIKTTPIVWNNSLYVAAEDRTIYCFHSNNF